MTIRTAVLGLWLDRPPLEVLDTAVLADGLGYPELWIGEMATFDAFALASAVAARTRSIPLTVGPLAVAVRTPATMAMGVATVAALSGRTVNLAVGSSSEAVVGLWHGRPTAAAGARLTETAEAVKPMLAGQRSGFTGRHVSTHGFRTRTGATGGTLTVAAFGPRAVAAAATHADRMVVNLVTPAAVKDLRAGLEQAAATVGRPPPRLAVWVAAAVDPTDETRGQLARATVPYLAARGYAEMFRAAGFGDLVDAARAGAPPSALLPDVPDDLPASVGVVGDVATVEARIDEYAAAGADEVCIVAATAGDDAGARTLRALAPR